MGVPKFFRYISERYPCLSEKLKEYQIPEFDNLYLDMNGIIHNCSHPNDADVSFRITEETIFKNIFHYIEILFRIVQPQKLFFLAVDGVAPRAKINQQRGRRFRAAKDAEVQEAKARAKGQEIPKEARFDSNCITPGTVFMSRLNEQLKYFITYKISTDKLWQKCKVILSGSEVPGEGEHKIMDYIRYMKAQPNYEGNTRHCLYGLDADLIMLGLCSHEPHFSLLREEVKFGKQQKKILTPEETNFCLLHLSLMREYLEHEFSPVKDKLTFKFDIEKIIDDWILMGFLVGNDFIPHLPNLHIENGALPILYNAYMEVLPTLNGYINEAGTLNLERFEKFMENLSSLDLQQFDEIYADLKYFEGKTGRRMNESERNSKSSPDENASPKRTINKALSALIMATEDELGESEDDDENDSDDDTDMQLEFTQHKRDYYMNKMEYEKVDAEIMRSQAEGYIRAIQWNLHYYYNGCCSWSWYYPHHYAPFISDIRNFKNLELEFDMGTPFLPFEQLLAVLPAASKTLLPDAYHSLMTEENSPIIKYYPLDFKTDLNGKRQEWEAVVLIPLIDEKSLLEAMEPSNAKLTADEKKRNSHGPMCIFVHTDQDMGLYEAPQYFPSIRSHADMKLVKREEILIPLNELVKGLCNGVQLSVYYPGFPTLQHIPHKSALEKAKVKVFEQPSRKESMILTVQPKEVPDIDDLAKRWLGKTVFVSWPHLVEALVVGVANTKKKITIQYPLPKQASENSRNFNTENMTDPLLAGLNVHKKSITETYRTRFGIDVGKIDIVVHAAPMIGRQYVYSAQGKMTLEKQWNDNPMGFAYQAVLHDITVHNPDFIQFTSIMEVFVPKSICFMLGHPYYGARGEVVEPAVDLKTSRVKVAMNVALEPNFDRARHQQQETRLRYMPGNVAAQRLGISSHLLSRITGTILVINGDAANPANASKHNLGLNLKYNKKNEEVAGFTKKDHNSVWLYSTKAVDFVRSYMSKFPELFERLEQNLVTSDMFQRDDLFPQDGDDGVDAAVTWLKEQQKALNTTTRACGYDSLETDVVKTIEKDIDEYLKTQEQNSKTVIMHVKPHLLYKPGLNSGNIAPDSKAQHRLFDRIICVRENFTVPLGYKGTIVGVQKGDNPLLNMYEVLFDKPFVGGIVIHECSPNRSCRLSSSDFINISYGIQAENKNNVNKVNVPSPTNWRQQQQQQQQPQPQQQQQHPNRFINQIEQRGSWRQQQQKQQQQPQAPDPSTLNSFYPDFTKNGQQQRQNQGGRNQQNKIGFNESPTHQRRQQTQFPQPPIVLQRAPDAARKPNNPMPQLQQLGGPKVVQGVTEFQALWNELNKMQNKMPKPADSPKRQAPLPHTTDKPNPPSSAVKDSPQDPSAFLKAMLKISDESSAPQSTSSSISKPTTVPTATKAVVAATTVLQTQQPPSKPIAFPTQTTKTTDTPPLVQQLFDQARQAEKSGKNIWYCSQLLSHYQLLGSGFPRYVYCANKDGTVCAQIILPDMRTFCGEFSRTHADAAESAAKKVYEELGLGKAPPPIMRSNVRPQPLQQWFHQHHHHQQQQQQQQQQQPPPPRMAPGPNVRQPPPPQANIKPMLPAGFPQVPMQAPPMMHGGPMMPPMPKWTPMVPQQNPNFPTGPKPPVMNQNRFAYQQPQQSPNNQQDGRNKTEVLKKSTNFVPLQAQKKTRHPRRQPGEEKQQSLQQKQQQERNDAPQQNRVEQKPKENLPKETKQDKGSPNKSTDAANPNNQLQNAQQKSQKNAKPKRSRVAAKFLSDPVSNGDRQ